ncbi:hypothetical protein [Endothiovibrio diazotrophicus]
MEHSGIRGFPKAAPHVPDSAALHPGYFLALLPEGEITDLSQLPDTIPAYLISVTPELKVDGETVLSGTPMQLGEDLDFVYTLTNPVYGTLSYPGKVVAGSYLSVAIIGGSVAPEKLTALKTKLEGTQTTLTTQDQTQLAALSREDILGDMFYAGTLGYFAESQGLAHVMTLQQKAHMQQLPSGGTYGYVPQVDYFWGLPNAIRTGGIAMDLDALNITAQTDDGANKFNLVFQLGALSSALEHAIPEQMFVTADHPGEAVSTVKALSKAQQQGQKIYHITQANLSTALADIRLDNATIQEIKDAVATGKEVITHTDPISVPGWSGAGYAVFDPVKGDGAWRISGGDNGSYMAGLFFGMLLSVLAVMAISSTGGLALPILASFLLHAGLFELFVVADASSSGIEGSCFFGGLLAGLSAISLVLIPLFGNLEAVIGSVVTAFGYGAVLLDLDGTREGCGL